jgi:hypothetical protein
MIVFLASIVQQSLRAFAFHFLLLSKLNYLAWQVRLFIQHTVNTLLLHLVSTHFASQVARSECQQLSPLSPVEAIPMLVDPTFKTHLDFSDYGSHLQAA